jgi:hypothetical protein
MAVPCGESLIREELSDRLMRGGYPAALGRKSERSRKQFSHRHNGNPLQRQPLLHSDFVFVAGSQIIT